MSNGAARSRAPQRRYVYAAEDPLRAAELARSCGLSPVLGQVLINRDLRDAERAGEYLGPKLSRLARPDSMADRAVAADRLATAIRKRERIVVFGDYDVDGTTSTAILSGILEELGGTVTALIASRFEGGYGLSEAGLARVLAAKPQVLVTCDCGTSDHARVARAASEGIDVLVVDHHLVPAEPLKALAFLNPHRPDCGFPFKHLCSAGLAFSLGAAVRAALSAKLDLRPYLDLVALGTIADVMPLSGDNRALVRAGLALLGGEAARPGILALREVAKLRGGEPLSAVDVAFRLTPRLNAPGRLSNPALTLALLRSRDLTEARELAQQVDRINGERRTLERAVTAAAMEQVEQIQPEAFGVVAAEQGWHRGVVGISAARLVDRYQRPALVVGLDGDLGHGSGRAPEGFPLFQALARCANQLDRFGGHDAAVGFSVRAERVDDLRQEFARACAELAGAQSAAREVAVDARIRVDGFGLPRASELRMLEPMGEANPEPVFELSGEVVRAQIVGEGHLKVVVRMGAEEVGAFGFELGDQLPQVGSRVRVFGQLRPDTFRGGERVELRILELAPD